MSLGNLAENVYNGNISLGNFINHNLVKDTYKN